MSPGVYLAPDIHLDRKVWDGILDGYYMEIFTLLKPEGEEAHKK